MLRIVFTRTLGNSEELPSMQNNWDDNSFELEWVVGEKLVSGDLDDHKATVVEADGEELKWVEANFKNLPFVYQKQIIIEHESLMPMAETTVLVSPQKWRGDFAAFIGDHLPRSISGVKIRAEV